MIENTINTRKVMLTVLRTSTIVPLDSHFCTHGTDWPKVLKTLATSNFHIITHSASRNHNLWIINSNQNEYSNHNARWYSCVTTDPFSCLIIRFGDKGDSTEWASEFEIRNPSPNQVRFRSRRGRKSSVLSMICSHDFFPWFVLEAVHWLGSSDRIHAVSAEGT